VGEIPFVAGGPDVALHRGRDRRQMTKPPRALHRSDASLRDGDGRQAHRPTRSLREAMKESGLGTPADPCRDDRDVVIRREYIGARRQGPSRRTPKGIQGDHHAGGPQVDAPRSFTGDWEHKLSDIEHGRGRTARSS